jgi:hypothetical protein
LRKSILAIAGLALVASGAFASLGVVSSADHRDSPTNIANPTADINDVYAFRSPENNNNLVVALSVNPLIAPADNQRRGVFDPSVQFQVHVDRNGDLGDEATVNIRMTSAPPQLIFEGLGAPLVVPITPPTATSPMVSSFSNGAIKIFAGLRDDPFFFDLTGFQQFIANPQAPARGLRTAAQGAPTDTFAGMNVLAIVMELPITALTGGTASNTGTIRTWVSSTRGGQRIDRMGIPTINTALIPSAQKDAFNVADPVNDAASYRATAATTIRTLRGAVDPLFGGATTQGGGPLGGLTPEQVAAALIPDVVTINFANPVQFPNGRRLQDDVIDAALGVVLNRGGAAGIADGISANDRPFGTTFPYLAEPHQAAAPAATPGTTTTVRPPSTGDGGLLDDSGRLWTLSAAFLAGAVALGGIGLIGARRHSR